MFEGNHRLKKAGGHGTGTYPAPSGKSPPHTKMVCGGENSPLLSVTPGCMNKDIPSALTSVPSRISETKANLDSGKISYTEDIFNFIKNSPPSREDKTKLKQSNLTSYSYDFSCLVTYYHRGNQTVTPGFEKTLPCKNDPAFSWKTLPLCPTENRQPIIFLLGCSSSSGADPGFIEANFCLRNLYRFSTEDLASFLPHSYDWQTTPETPPEGPGPVAARSQILSVCEFCPSNGITEPIVSQCPEIFTSGLATDDPPFSSLYALDEYELFVFRNDFTRKMIHYDSFNDPESPTIYTDDWKN